MPRFYFDFRQGDDHAPDVDGIEFATTEDAYLEAVHAAQEMWGELLKKRRDPTRCLFEVRDAIGRLLFTFPFQEVMENCLDRKPPAPPGVDRDYATATATATATARRVNTANRAFQHQLHTIRQTLDQSRQLLAVKV